MQRKSLESGEGRMLECFPSCRAILLLKERLSEIVGQREISKRLESYAKNRNLPNLLFSGPAGVGKTTSAIALAKELFAQSFQQNFLELNASDSRGIDVVRGEIKDFSRTLAFNTNFKIIFLDESDALTADAQQALRRTMEKYTKTCRFILSCNYSSRIIEPIQSRCVIFRFKPLNPKDVEGKLGEIAKGEGIKVDDGAVRAITYVGEGDLRKCINVLQAASALSKDVKEKTVYEVAAMARPEEVKKMVEVALQGKFLEARKLLEELMYNYGMSGEDVINQIYKEIVGMSDEEMPGKTRVEIVDIIGEYNFRMVEGANERVQLEALLAQFGKFKK